MRTRIQRWGNHLSIRIPELLAASLQLAEGKLVELSAVDGKLVVSPIEHPDYTLEGLLSQVTDENTHPETDTGSAVGKEVW